LALLSPACAVSPRAEPVSWPAAPRDLDSLAIVSAAAERFPNSGGVQRQRLGAALEAGDRPTALDAMRRLAAMGAVVSAASQDRLRPLLGSDMAPVSALMAANAEPIAASRLHAMIPAEHRLIEGLVWDEAARRLYATSVVARSLVSVDGNTQPSFDGLGSLLGGAFDASGRRLWLASAELEQTPRDRPNFVGIVVVDLRAPGLARRIAAPEGATPGDVAYARDGTAYASDGLNGALYVCRPGCTALETLLPAGSLFSAQGMALSQDQRRLYIADRRYGLAVLDRRSGRLLRVTAPPEIMLDGIDGLVLHDGDLIATQTAYAPARIVRLELAPGGLQVARLTVLERANPEWGEVTLMAIDGDRLFYVAGAQWDSYGAGGEINSAMPPGPTPVRRLDLRR
jgi:hypothetical protein